MLKGVLYVNIAMLGVLAKTTYIFTNTSFNSNISNMSTISKKSETTGRTMTHLKLLHEPNLSFCPSGFSYYNDEDYPVCYLVTEPQPFPPKCPYPQFLSLNDLERIKLLENFEDDVLWTMITRDTKDGFGPFESLYKDSSYQQPITGYVRKYGDIPNENCMVFTKNILIPVNCKEKHVALCAYPYHHDTISTYCNNHFKDKDGYLTCISDSIDNGNHKCYCERSHWQHFGEYPPPNSFCDMLAEPWQEFQTILLLSQLNTVNDVCWFGLYIDETGTVKWKNSKEEVDYTFWSTDIDKSKSEGALRFINPTGWVLGDIHSGINCGICELRNDYSKKVNMHLEFVPEENAIKLTINNGLEISDYFGLHYLSFCFVGPTIEKFKQIIPLNPGSTSNVKQIVTNEPQIHYLHNDWEYPVYYWCEAFQHPNLKPVSSNRILVENSMGGHEYALQVIVRTAPNKDPYLDNLHSSVTTYIEQNIDLPNRYVLRPMRVLKYDQAHSYMEMLLHLTTTPCESPTREYQILLDNWRKMIQNEASFILDVPRFGRTDVCMATTSSCNDVTLHWPEAKIGTNILPEEICLDKNGVPIRRKCDGDFLFGAAWSKSISNCNIRADLSEREKRLYDLLSADNLSAGELTGNLSLITENPENISVLEIHLISEIMEKLEKLQEDIVVDDITGIMSNIMNFNLDQLKVAQKLLNSTDKMLSSVDNIFKTIAVNEDDVSVATSSNFLVQINDVENTNIKGVLLKRINYNKDNLESYELVPIYKNVSYEELLQEDFEIAACLPEAMLDSKTRKAPSKLIMSLFHDDSLFNGEISGFGKVDNRIISILLPNYEVNQAIPVFFKSRSQEALNETCVHWKYGYDAATQQNLQGFWSKNKEPTQNSTYKTCRFNHTTHFALLTFGGIKLPNISKEHKIALDIITAVGTALSLISIVLIFIIACACKNWRRKASNKILLNFSAALALQMILLFISDNIKKDKFWCSFVGAALHYIILAEFIWMLIIAILQYRKFVIVFNNRIPYLVIKACLICWILPLIPVGIGLLTSDDTYTKNSYGLCYPKEKYFLYGLVLPISLIVLINLFVFLKIIYTVSHRKIESYGSKENSTKLQLSLAVFLFFLLGISWIFGLASGFGGGIVFSYLFCITATTQGLVLFLFFVVMSEKSKVMWVHMKRRYFSTTHKRRVSNSSCSPTQFTE